MLKQNEDYLEQSQAKVCPGCQKKLEEKDIIDVDADDNYDYFLFSCHGCEFRFRVEAYHGDTHH